MQEDVNHYEIRGRIVKISRIKRGGVFGKPSLQLRVETRGSGERAPTSHSVLLVGEHADRAYYEACVGDTIHVSGGLRFHTWKDSGTERSAPYLDAVEYQFVAFSEQREAVQKQLERSVRR